MKKYAIIVAGGQGLRMQSDTPKQFMHLAGKPLLYYTITAFLTAEEDISIILVLPEQHIGVGQEIIDAWFSYDKIQFCIGGATRFHSVQNGLEMVTEESIVAVHDAVRCMVTPALITKCFKTAEELGTAIPTVGCTDSVRILQNENNESFPRSNVRLVQTPQVFHSKILLPAYSIDYKEKFTDEASVVDAFGMKLSLVEGDEDNIKITTPKDIVLAEYLLGKKGTDLNTNAGV